MGILLQSGKRRTLVRRNGVIVSKRRAPAVSYLLRDDFTDTVAAGSVDGTAATPGPGTRTIIDTASRVSTADGKAQILGKFTWGDPAIWLDAVARERGRMVIIDYTKGAADQQAMLGWASSQSGLARENTLQMGDGTDSVRVHANNATLTLSAGASEISGAVTVALRTAGAFYFKDTGGLLYHTTDGTASTVYPAATAHTANPLALDFIRVPDVLWLPVPLVSDGAFGVTTDGAGHAETSGLGSGGSGLSWTDNKGVWSGGSASSLSGGEAIRTVDAGNADVFVDLDITRSGGNASLVLRYTDDDNYLRLGTDGTNAILVEKVGGVENTLSTTAITYGAGNTMRIRLEGQAARIYYNNAFVVAESSINAALTGTRIGLYTTDTGNSFDNLVAYASTGYTELNQYAS